jgi:hypothetical protein
MMGEEMTKDHRSATKGTPLSSYDKRFGTLAYGALVLAILFSTFLHHLHPQILRVPDNLDPRAWERPALDETILADRLTESGKAQFLEEGVPLGDSLPAQFAADLFALLLSWICFLHARKHFGFWMATCFLIGSFVFTGLEETLWILSGRFFGGMVNNPLGERAFGTYWFTRGGFWFLETPIVACLGWFFIAYTCVLTAGKVFPRMGLLERAIIGGLTAVGIDLWMDPIQTAPVIMAWVWGKADVLHVFGIPHYNFLGWFLLIFLFAIFWERLPEMERKWGRPAATTRFLAIILTVPFAILFFIWTWIFALGILLSWMGLEQALYLPSGW